MAELNDVAQQELKDFAGEMILEYPSQMRDIMSLQTVIDEKLPPESKETLIIALNEDAPALIERAKSEIAKDPSVLGRVNENPEILMTMMGADQPSAPAKQTVVETPPPAPTAPASPETPPVAVAPAAPTALAAEPATLITETVAAPVAATASVSAPQAEDPAAAGLQERISQSMATIAQAGGFEDFMKTVKGNPDLEKAFTSLMGGDGDPEKTAKFLENIAGRVEDNPQFFNEINEMVKDAPPQMVATMARKIAEDPDAGFAQLDMAMTMQNNPIFSGMSGILGVVGQHLMGIMGPLMQILGDFLGNIPGMLGGLMDKISSYAGDISQTPRHVVTNDPNGERPLTEALDKANGNTPQTITSNANGAEISGVTAPAAGTPQQRVAENMPRNTPEHTPSTGG